MLPRRVVLIAGVIASVATVQLIMNVAVGQTGSRASEPKAKVTSSVHIAPAPAAQPAKPKKPATKEDAPAAKADAPKLEMAVTEVTTESCPDKKHKKTRLGLMEKSSVHSVCP